MEVDGVPSQDDHGLRRLLPLYHFLQNTCVKAAFDILVREFRNTQYIRDNLDKQVKRSMKFQVLLYQIHNRTKTYDKGKKKKGQGGSGTNSQSQENSSHNRRSQQITNIKENEYILSQVTVEDLLDANEKCKVLMDLDLIFILNVIINETIKYTLSDSLLEAIIQIKDIRKVVFHPRYSFSEDAFDKNLKGLVKATYILYKHLGYSLEQVDEKENACRKEATQGDTLASTIIDELQSEFRTKYAALQNFIAPNISNAENLSENLENFIDQESRRGEDKLPILLCGHRGTGKAQILQSLAFSFSRLHSDLASKFLLVLHLDDWDRRYWSWEVTGEEFWDQIFKCVKSLAPGTVSKYGLDSIKEVIKMYKDRILFLINLDVSAVGHIRKEVQQGTWLITYHGSHPPSVDWQILKVKPYEEAQVKTLLMHLNYGHHEDILRLYETCEYKGILTSLDMIKIFSKLTSKVTTGTDFDIAKLFVSKELSFLNDEDREEQVLKLGEIAFHAMRKARSVLDDNALCNVQREVKDKFLVHLVGSGLTFIHCIVQDFMAAKYVICNPDKACMKWLQNTESFKRVFKFACSLWCKDPNELEKNLEYIKQYLIHLFKIKDLIKYRKSNRNNVGKVETVETNKKKKQKSKNKIPVFVNPVKDPFTKWNFILHLDDVCRDLKILDLLADLLSHIPCWSFNAEKYFNNGQLIRIEKILSKVKLHKESPVMIRLESGTGADMEMLIELWNKIKNISSIHDRCRIKIIVTCNSSVPFEHDKCVSDFFKVIERAHCPVYISHYTGPFVGIPNILKCKCLRKLEKVDVSVYDVASLQEILSCKEIISLKDVSVRVDLKVSEQECFDNRCIEIPKNINLKLSIKYFNNIQKLLNTFKFPEHLSSLSLHDLFINENFKLDLSAFQKVESLYIRCKPNIENENKCKSRGSDINEAMEIDLPKQVPDHMRMLPRCTWMFQLKMNLSLPPNLERLMLRNVEFYNNSNNHLLLEFCKSNTIKRLVILDSLLSLKGVRKVVSTHTDSVNDLEKMTKKLRVDRSHSSEMKEFIDKNPRLSESNRKERRRKKPPGKEIIITSELALCTKCKKFPCGCPPQAGEDNNDTFEDLVNLIEDIYHYDILSFTYTSNIISVRKDLCHDLKVHFAVTMLDDAVASALGSTSDGLCQLFFKLTLAQCISFYHTNLSDNGVLNVIHHLKHNKGSYCTDGAPEPFSLTIESFWHPSSHETLFSELIKFIKIEKCLAVFNFWCMCPVKCYKLKKFQSGNIQMNDKPIKNM